MSARTLPNPHDPNKAACHIFKYSLFVTHLQPTVSGALELKLQISLTMSQSWKVTVVRKGKDIRSFSHLTCICRIYTTSGPDLFFLHGQCLHGMCHAIPLKQAHKQEFASVAASLNRWWQCVEEVGNHQWWGGACWVGEGGGEAPSNMISSPHSHDNGRDTSHAQLEP